MQDPIVPDRYLQPKDYADETESREDWVARTLFESRVDRKVVQAALEWDSENTGSGGVFEYLGLWYHSIQYHGNEEGKKGTATDLASMVDEVLEDYINHVLWPQHAAKDLFREPD